jgi:hypothetical protein
MSFLVKILISLIFGITLGAFLFAIGVGVGGIGHGWVTPLWFSFIGPVIFPIVIFRLLSFGDHWLGFDIALVGLGVILDMVIYKMTLEEGVHYFNRAGEFAYVWIAAWMFWQVAIMIKVGASIRASKNLPPSG